jgi:catechol 2,3-dioxygenase-like lactoylglutathione lyase family enzyme
VPTDIQVTFDCADPNRMAEFWAAALGYKLQDPPEGFESWEAFLTSVGVPESEWGTRNAVVDPEGRRPRLFFQQVPELRASKNRQHLDLHVGGRSGTPEERRARIDAEAQRLVGLGAAIVQPFEELGQYWVVMQDPEGNEFCVD